MSNLLDIEDQPKHYDPKYENQLLNVADAERDEWIRKVVDNSEMQLRIKNIQSRYRFPLRSHEEFRQWMVTNPSRERDLWREIKGLIELFGLRNKWKIPLFYLVGTGRPSGLLFSLGFYSTTAEGEPIIDSSVLIENPIVFDSVKRQQQELLLETDPPPRPELMQDNTRRKDWRPVVEWHNRHPDFPVSKLAEFLNYNLAYFSRKIKENKYSK